MRSQLSAKQFAFVNQKFSNLKFNCSSLKNFKSENV